jgi:glycosyltransferase involved in cell wall biosynthesis
MTKPMISILIPVYNREELVVRTIESAINQTYENIEVIAVDNKSTDKTYDVLKEYAKKYPNVKVYQNEENLGPVRNWKKCLEESSGDYIKILFSDDWIEENFVEECMEILSANDDVGFVFTTTLIHQGDKEKIFYDFSNESGLYATDVFIKGSLYGGNFPVSPCNALFRRLDVENNLILEIPNEFGFDFKKLGAGNDLLIFLLTASIYHYFGYISEPLTHFGAPSDSITISNDVSMYYVTAKEYFVDNFIKDKDLRRDFYTWLWLANAKNKGKFRLLLHINEVSIFKVLEILTNRAYQKAKAIISVANFSRHRIHK